MSNPCKLIRFTPFPPGEFPYSQSVDGKIYDFPSIGLDIQSQARQIASFRKSNNFPRSSFLETLEDLNIYTCQRLGCDPSWCSDGSQSLAQPQQVKSGGCATCGARV